MGRFGGRIGVLEALTFSTGIQLRARSLGILLVSRAGFGGFGGGSPLALLDVAGRRDGPDGRRHDHLRPAADRRHRDDWILIAGQLVMGALIDRYGLFGVDRIDISLPRAIARVHRPARCEPPGATVAG